MNTNQTYNLANVGLDVDVNINIPLYTAALLVAVITIGSMAFFICKRYI